MFDLFGRFGAAPGQAAHLAGHHGKTAPLLAGAGGLHSSVQRQDIGLKSDAVNHADDVGHALRAGGDFLHRADHFLHRLTAALRHLRGRLRQSVGLLGGVGVVAHGAAELLHRGGGLLQGAGLLLGAATQVQVGLGNFGAGPGHTF